MCLSCLRLMGFKAEAVFQKIEEDRVELATVLPTEADALRVMMCAYSRLKQLGWRDSHYIPTDGSIFHAIELGSTGIFEAHADPDAKGRCWLADAGDLWPSRPLMFKPIEKAS